MSVIALIAYLLFAATAPVSSQGPGGVSCCVDLSTPSCAAAYAYCRNSTGVPAGSASCQMPMCPKTASPSQQSLRMSMSPSSQQIRSAPPSMSTSATATATATQRLRPTLSNSQTQTPSYAPSASYTVSPAYPSYTHTATVSNIQPSSTATAGPTVAPTAAASTSAASGAASGAASSSATLSPTPTWTSASALAVAGGNSGAQPVQNQVVSTNVVAVVVVSACALMIVGVGGYIIMKKWSSTVQKNVVSKNTPVVKTENPIHEYKDKYVDSRVSFKPIKSGRSFSV